MTDQDTDDATEAQSSEEPFEDEPTEADMTEEPMDTGENGGDRTTGARVISMLQWAAFAILLLVALVATFRFYFAASNAINEFVTRQYRPVFQAIFNLVILLASALGLSVLVRRIA